MSGSGVEEMIILCGERGGERRVLSLNESRARMLGL